MPDRNLGTVDSFFSWYVMAGPLTGSLTSSKPPSPPEPNARAYTASPLSRRRDAQVWATPIPATINILGKYHVFNKHVCTYVSFALRP